MIFERLSASLWQHAVPSVWVHGRSLVTWCIYLVIRVCCKNEVMVGEYSQW